MKNLTATNKTGEESVNEFLITTKVPPQIKVFVSMANSAMIDFFNLLILVIITK